MLNQSMANLAPIIIFCYKRIDTLKNTITALQNNFLASESELFIFSDGAKNKKDEVVVNEVRLFLKSITGFKSIGIYESKKNKGLANSIIEGVTKIINEYGKVIVLEDDLITSKNFLVYINQALDYYEHKEKVFSIAAFTKPIVNSTDDVYFTYRANSTGWATWNNRWENIDWSVSDYDEFRKDKKKQKAFNRMGSDMCKMLNDQIIGKVNSWAIRWTYHQFKVQKLTVYPTLSKIKNIGTGIGASNSVDAFGRFDTVLDNSEKTDFSFLNNIELNPKYLKQFLKQYSIFTRVKYKILNLIHL